MVAPSKLYIDPICRLHCSQAIVHPGESCLMFILRNIYRQGISSGKYFLPMLISPLLLKWRYLNRELLQSALKFYMQTVCCATSSSLLIFSSVCFLRNVLGRYYKYTALSIPAFNGMLLCWFFPQRVVNLYLIATSQASIDVILRHRSNYLTRLICDSKYIQTLLFMLNSALILHFKRNKLYSGFWFIKPIELPKDIENSTDDTNNSTNCSHNGETCMKYLLNGLKSYLMIGVPLDLISNIMRGKMPSDMKGFWNIIKTKTLIQNLQSFKMTSFFLSYIGIYRLSNCMIQQLLTATVDYQWPHITSAFLGGMAYICLGKPTFYTLSLVIVIQILWQWLCSLPDKAKQEYWLMQQLKLVKFSKIIVPLNIGFLVHTFMYRYNMVSSLGRGFINGVTNNRAQAIYSRLMSNDTDTILKGAAAFTKKRLF